VVGAVEAEEEEEEEEEEEHQAEEVSAVVHSRHKIVPSITSR
jgi:hypothetical protein